MSNLLDRKRKFWLLISAFSGLLLVAAFILFLYSITALNGCLERTLSSTSSWEGLCSLPGLKSAVAFNWALGVLVCVSFAGLVGGIVKSERIVRKLQHDEEGDEPIVEERVNTAQLPDISRSSQDADKRTKGQDSY